MVEPIMGGGDLAKKGLVLARSLIEMENEVVPLRMFNPGRETRVAQRGTTVGVASAVGIGYIDDCVGVSSDPNLQLPIHLEDLYERGRSNVEARYQ